MPDNSRSHSMRRFTLTVPYLDNHGRKTDHLADVKAALAAEGITGWTEYFGSGAWRGHEEPVSILEVYRATNHKGFVERAPREFVTARAFAAILGLAAR